MMKSIICTWGEGKKKKSHIEQINKTQIVALMIQVMIRMQRFTHVKLAEVALQLIGRQLGTLREKSEFLNFRWIYFHLTRHVACKF